MKRKIIKVEIPKEIWDASTSICGSTKVFTAWCNSIKDVIKQYNMKNK